MLYLCATPIGNLEDVTLRVLRVLRECDAIFAEDTRRARKLLTHYDIHKRVGVLNQVNERRVLPSVMARLSAGEDIALLSDAGMPGISDPGYSLVTACVEDKVPFTVLPGASSVLTAVVGSGLPTHDFRFAGFLPKGRGQRRVRLQALMAEAVTTVFFESPKRLPATLKAMADIDENRQVVVARELTKMFEEYMRGSAAELATITEEHAPKGEVVVVVAGKSAEAAVLDDQAIVEMVDELSGEVGKKEAIKEVASRLGLPRRQVYDLVVGRRRG